jgi:Cd2+/Zn2+-exporting ATPase
MTASSLHPLSKAIHQWAMSHQQDISLSLQIEELPGRGLVGRLGDRKYFLGKVSWIQEQLSSTTGFSSAKIMSGATLFCDEHGLIAQFELEEELHPSAQNLVKSLLAEGFELWLHCEI